MGSIILRELTAADEALFRAGLKAWDGHDLSWYSFEWNPAETYQQMLDKMQALSAGVTLPEGFVPATMFYGFASAGIVGRVHVRHRLNDKLLQRGGHIGYAVAPAFRGRGYATEMFRQTLPICRQRWGIDRLLITCDDSNAPSIKIIEQFGGVLENKIVDEAEQRTVRRYWLALD